MAFDFNFDDNTPDGTSSAPGNFQTVAANPQLFNGINLPQWASTGIDTSRLNPYDSLPGYGTPLSYNAPALSTDLSSSPIGTGMFNVASGQVPQGSTGGSFIQNLLGGDGQNLADLSSILGKFSTAQAGNRALRAGLTQNYDKIAMDAEQNRNKTESDALKKLAVTSYLKGGGANYQPPTISLNGQTRTAPAFSFAPKPASAEQIQGASDLQSQLMGRLKPGGTYTPQPLSSYANPGVAEDIGNYGALGLSGLGALQGAGGGNTAANIVGGLGNVAKAATSIPWSKVFSWFGGGGDGS